MMLDKEAMFSDVQAVTASAISANVIDLTLGQANLTTIDIGTGEEIYLWVSVGTTATSGGSATLVVTLESDSTANLATSATTHWTSPSVAVAALVAGYNIAKVRLPAGSYERYLGVRYTVSTADLTAGTFTAGLLRSVQAQRLYRAGSVVL